MYYTLVVKTSITYHENNQKNQHPNPAQQECLWMMPSISPLYRLQNVALLCTITDINSKEKTTYQPTINPQNHGFNDRVLRPRN